MIDYVAVLQSHKPCADEVYEYIGKWNALEDYVDQENALNKLFCGMNLRNSNIEDVLIKCSALNDFYSTNIFKIHNVAKHYLKQNIDDRLLSGDL